MGSGRVGRGGGCKGGPDNNVTIRPPPRTSRAVEESESKQWSVAEGVSGSGEGRGERGVRAGGGFSLPGSRRRPLLGGGRNVCVCGCMCTQVGCTGARRSQGSSTPVLACGLHLQVCVLETHYCTGPLAHCFCCL